MLDRRRIFAIGCIFAVCAAAPSACRSPAKPFDQAAFAASLSAGGPVVVQVSAPWCPICRAQKPALDSLRDQQRFRHFELYEIDFDTDKASVRAVRAQLQSTLILFKDGKEIARTVGDREPGWIEDLLEKGL